MKTRVPILIAALAAVLGAQEAGKEAPRASRATRLVEVRHIPSADLSRAVSLLEIFGAGLRADPNLRMIAVTGPPELVDAVEAAIRRMDTPPAPQPAPRNIEVTLFVLLGSAKPDGEGGPPAALDDVLKQLRAVFAYPHYRLLDTQSIRTRDNPRLAGPPASLAGVMPEPGVPGGSLSYELQFYPVTGGDARTRTVRLDGLSFTTKRGARIRTDIDIREGQKVVVGKTSFEPGSALFLVVTAKVTD